MQKSTLFLVMTLSVGLSSTPTLATQINGGEVSIWDPNLMGQDLYPITNENQFNGEFVVDTYVGAVIGGKKGVQAGLRSQNRSGGVPPTLVRKENTYFANLGNTHDSTGDGTTWNYDIHLDFGTEFLSAQQMENPPLNPGNMRDFVVTFMLDTDPSAAQNFISTDLNDFATTTLGIDPSDPILLFQISQNVLSSVLGGGPGVFDPNARGIYDFHLSVFDEKSDPANPHTVVESQMRIMVVPLPAAAWMGIFLLGSAGIVRGIRGRQSART